MVKRHAIIAGGVVVNVASAEPDFAAEQGWIAIPDELPVSPGWTFDEGGFHAPAPTPLPVPAEVTMRQARLALLQIGLLDDVAPMIEQIEDVAVRRAAQIEWEYSSAVKRNNPLINMLGGALGLSQSQIDDLFRAAAQIP